MASNKRRLKLYARYDGSGRIVPSSSIWRKKMPKIGRWVELQGYECCNYTSTTTTTTSAPVITTTTTTVERTTTTTLPA